MSQTLSHSAHLQAAPTDPRLLYCDLMKKVLTRHAFGETWKRYQPRPGTIKAAAYESGRWLLNRGGLELVLRSQYDPQARAEGRDWPADAETMIGLQRLDNLQDCLTDVIEDGVPGDVIETGVWRGGAVIFMRALLKAYGVDDRTVWVADSFRGLPKPDPSRREDTEDALWKEHQLAIPLEQVKANFQRYGLLDEQVQFLPGWFEDTLPTAPLDRIAVMRLDGDLYDSTMVALRSLYPKLSPGGYVIIDDYHSVRGCKQAVDDFRAEHGITSELRQVDWTCRYWRRTA